MENAITSASDKIGIFGLSLDAKELPAVILYFGTGVAGCWSSLSHRELFPKPKKTIRLIKALNTLKKLNGLKYCNLMK